MSVILSPRDYEAWLDPELHDPEPLGKLLRPYPAQQMTAYPVSTRVNSPWNDDEECIQPATPSSA